MVSSNSTGVMQKRPPLSPSSEDRGVFCWKNTPRSPTSTFDVMHVVFPQKKSHSSRLTQKTARSANTFSDFTPEENCPFDEKEEETSDTESVIGESTLGRFSFSTGASLMRNLSTDTGDEDELLGLRFIDDTEGDGVGNIGVFDPTTLRKANSDWRHFTRLHQRS